MSVIGRTCVSVAADVDGCGEVVAVAVAVAAEPVSSDSCGGDGAGLVVDMHGPHANDCLWES